ncbi:Na+/H+ antiporter NhaA [Amycolatopsis sp. NPDC051903]|uniref:Na+/H+ antiporter NhaA n=1 Tax=Amycolatopsis sp. NPDC051903 TaxID=3363936 RepID=UPI0037A11AC0
MKVDSSRFNEGLLPRLPSTTRQMNVPLPYVSAGFRRFLATEAGSAVLLLAATVAALVWANVAGVNYDAFWGTHAGVEVGTAHFSLNLRDWVNDVAMVVFFAVVGLEISREVSVGELHDVRSIVVPACGALGGLALPAIIYFLFNSSGAAAVGWGIPMSSDTAFLIGVLALFGPRCPDQLRLFLLTLAIGDDIGAITVMAVFYTHHVSVPALVVAAVLILALLGLRWLGVWRLTPYLVVGVGLWAAVDASGVHPTLAGVLIGLIVPAGAVDGHTRERLRLYGRAVIERADAVRVRLATTAMKATLSANERLQAILHPISAYVIIPVFGLANAGVQLDSTTLRTAASSTVTLGVAVGLIVGNTVGISLGAGIALRTGLGNLPGRVRYGHLIGGAILAGIGFTIALFITGLAFTDPGLQQQAKVGVLAGSLFAAVLGSVVLRVLGERLPLCSFDERFSLPELPEGPWLDPSLA